MNARCPVCNSTAEITELAPGVYGLTIHHDDTCPTLATIRTREAS